MGKVRCIMGCKYRKSNYYFRFPDDKDVQISWLKMLGKERLQQKNLDKWAVCQKHFTQQAILAFENVNSSQNTIPKEDNHLPDINIDNTAFDTTQKTHSRNPSLDEEETISEKESTPDDHIKSAITTLQNVMMYANSQCFANQKQPSFGMYVENELSSLDKHSVSVAKYFINEILYEASTGGYKDVIDSAMAENGLVRDNLNN